MKLKNNLILAAALAAAGIAPAHAGNNDTIQALADKAIAESFLPGENQDLSRLKQDDTLRACNQYRGNVPDKVAAAITERESKNIKYPADGKMLGDWKKGQKAYTAGFAYRIGTIEPDDPKKERGGNEEDIRKELDKLGYVEIESFLHNDSDKLLTFGKER